MEPEIVDFSAQRQPSNYSSRRLLGAPEKPKMVTYIMSAGLAKTEAQAYSLLKWTVIISFAIIIILFAYFVLGIGNPTQVRYNFPQELKDQLNIRT